MDREKYLKDTGGIIRIQTTELLDEIERLWKEKEWLINYYGIEKFAQNKCYSINEYKEQLLNTMQQTLKEKKCQSTKQ